MQRAPSIRVIDREANIAPFDHARSSPLICPQRTTVYQVRTGHQPGSVTDLRVQSHWSYLSLDGEGSVAPTVGNEQLAVRLMRSRVHRDRHNRCPLTRRHAQTRRDAPNSMLQPDCRHQQLTGDSDRSTVDCRPGRIAFHSAASFCIDLLLRLRRSEFLWLSIRGGVTPSCGCVSQSIV
jgi:hypothetical protein